jgi:hypothetical protein
VSADDAALHDHVAIQDVMVRYGHGVDMQDFDMVASCFTAGARAEYGGRTLEPGVDGVVAYIRSRVGAYVASMHTMGTVRVEVHGDTADAVTYGVAYLVLREGDGQLLRIRGLTYTDALVRQPDGWRIAQRVHRVVWMTDAPALSPEIHRPITAAT